MCWVHYWRVIMLHICSLWIMQAWFCFTFFLTCFCWTITILNLLFHCMVIPQVTQAVLAFDKFYYLVPNIRYCFSTVSLKALSDVSHHRLLIGQNHHCFIHPLSVRHKDREQPSLKTIANRYTYILNIVCDYGRQLIEDECMNKWTL